MSERSEPTVRDVSDWWSTAISRIEPNVIELRGRPIQDLIGNMSFTGMINKGPIPPSILPTYLGTA